ncbi:hypothetical protein [Streptomyces sp. NPDC017448]|uniref:hypothetical protein n=1 Tax=Streptomyces sp. NPDC017448 TaxID=3364996 RepID=UPI00379561EE
MDELRLLLSTTGEPMSRRALQDRITRLGERLTAGGVSVNCITQWGRTAFLGLKDVGDEARGKGIDRRGRVPVLDGPAT